MGVYAYQAADWSVDVRHSTMFGYVTKITLGYPREIIPFIDKYATFKIFKIVFVSLCTYFLGWMSCLISFERCQSSCEEHGTI